MSNEVRRRPLLVVLSAPSGAGKTTLRQRLLAQRSDFTYSVSCTTRPPQPGEVDGADYRFLTPAEFARRTAAGFFLEHAEVHGLQYGTPRQAVEDALRRGRHVLMDLDVQGAASVRTLVQAAAPGDLLRTSHVDIFIVPPSLAVLRQRLEKRGQDAPEVIARRLKNAEAEMRRAGEFRYVIVNDDLETAYGQLVAAVEREATR